MAIDLDIFSKRDSYKHWSKEHVRYGDLDPVGHANNAAYATYFESARVGLLAEIKGSMDGSDPRYDAAVVQLNISFLKELRLNQDIEIGTLVTNIGNSSMQLISGLFIQDTCCALCECVTVYFDKKERRAAPIPSFIRENLSKYA